MKKIIGLLLIGIMLAGCATTKVNINTNVDGARVIVDGRLLGQTPIISTKIKNNTGNNYPIIIEKEGYKTYRGNLYREDKMGAIVATTIGYIFAFPFILPLLLCINGLYINGPVADQYFILEAEAK